MNNPDAVEEFGGSSCAPDNVALKVGLVVGVGLVSSSLLHESRVPEMRIALSILIARVIKVFLVMQLKSGLSTSFLHD